VLQEHHSYQSYHETELPQSELPQIKLPQGAAGTSQLPQNIAVITVITVITVIATIIATTDRYHVHRQDASGIYET
jgi:hypothetical protein